MDKGFLFRRLGFLIPCVLRTGAKGLITLNNKHKISSFQDVFLNPFYWQALFKLNFIPKKVFDLGANFGLFSCLCQQIFSNSINQEPIAYTLIEANLNLIKTLNKDIQNLIPQGNVSIVHGAAGPTENINFSTNNSNLLASSISKTGVEVPFVDFNLLEQPDLLKIDIEGAEDLLFKNYFNWIKLAKAIIIEFHYEGEKLKINQLQLKDAGFELILEKIEASGYRNQLWTKKAS
jgi:FkbM family methyltransferase